MSGFQRSRRFGLIGVVVVAVLAAAIALLFGQGSANPTGAIIAIFVLVFGFVAVLMHLQRCDLDAARSQARIDLAAAGGGVVDPGAADQMSLLAALATSEIDRDAIGAATERGWETAGASIGSGARMAVLILCAVVPWQLWQFEWSLIVFVPIIVGYAIFLGARALMAGGTIERAYDDAEPTLRALGLHETERPRVQLREQPAGPQPIRHEVEGEVAYAGQRHGRQVRIRIGNGSTVEVAGPTAPFSIRARDRRLRASDESPPELAAVLEPLAPSAAWSGVSMTGGENGVVVERGSYGGENWLRDLWLAEHVADAAARR